MTEDTPNTEEDDLNEAIQTLEAEPDAIVDKPGRGRPSKYSEEMVDKAKHYLENYEDYQDVIPQLAGLAIALDISRDTLYSWMNDESKQEFSYIAKKVMAAQEKSLFNGGLSGGFNPAITKLMLTKHGYHDKQEVDQNTKVSINIDSKDADCA